MTMFLLHFSKLITLNLKYSMQNIQHYFTLTSSDQKNSWEKFNFENESFSYFPAQPHTKYSSQDQMTGF